MSNKDPDYTTMITLMCWPKCIILVLALELWVLLSSYHPHLLNMDSTMSPVLMSPAALKLGWAVTVHMSEGLSWIRWPLTMRSWWEGVERGGRGDCLHCESWERVAIGPSCLSSRWGLLHLWVVEKNNWVVAQWHADDRHERPHLRRIPFCSHHSPPLSLLDVSALFSPTSPTLFLPLIDSTIPHHQQYHSFPSSQDHICSLLFHHPLIVSPSSFPSWISLLPLHHHLVSIPFSLPLYP